MGFFDDLVVPCEAGQAPPDSFDLGPYGGESADRQSPPADWFLPAAVPEPLPLGTGRRVRVMLKGWSVWPVSATVHLAVFQRRIQVPAAVGAAPGPGALRVGLLLADGRRITTLDGWLPGGREPALRPLTSGSVGFQRDIDLYLTHLPPGGTARLVVEWPDEGVPETRVVVDAAAVREAAARAVEIWPG